MFAPQSNTHSTSSIDRVVGDLAVSMEMLPQLCQRLAFVLCAGDVGGVSNARWHTYLSDTKCCAALSLSGNRNAALTRPRALHLS